MSSSTTHLFVFSNLIFYNFFNVINLLNLAYLANGQIHHSIELFHNGTCNLVIRFLWPCYQLRLLAIVLIWCISNLTLAFSSQLLPWWSLSDDDVTLTSTAIFFIWRTLVCLYWNTWRAMLWNTASREEIKTVDAPNAPVHTEATWVASSGWCSVLSLPTSMSCVSLVAGLSPASAICCMCCSHCTASLRI